MTGLELVPPYTRRGRLARLDDALPFIGGFLVITLALLEALRRQCR
jgi:hypothetical protein